MKAQNALKPTGRAVDESNELDGATGYIQWNVADELYWYDRKTGKARRIVEQKEMFSETYEPYHEVKEIRPNAAGELWVWDGLKIFIYHDLQKGLTGIDETGQKGTIHPFMVHGQRGFTRIDPPVENEADEVCGKSTPFIMDEMSARAAGKYPQEIVIDRVEWYTDGEVVYPRAGFGGWKSLVGRPPMKMILIPQEKDEHQS